MARIRLRTEQIADREEFHNQFQRLVGFPAFYGRNMDAWIDCMSSLRDGDGMTAVVLGPDEALEIEVPDAVEFRLRAPELFQDLVDCSAFVNRRYRARGEGPALVLALE